MKMHKLNKNILLFTFDTQKEMALTFFRVEEYYESPHRKLWNTPFSTDTFLDVLMDDKGNIDYFSAWSGFNIPGPVVDSWAKEVDKFSSYEESLISKIQENVYGPDYYIIGALEKDKGTINHEIAHALYFTKEDYKKSAEEITSKFKKNFKKQYAAFSKHLLDMGYRNSVVDDEIQAYLSAEQKNYLSEEFNIDFSANSKKENSLSFNDLRKDYVKLLRKYNTFKW